VLKMVGAAAPRLVGATALAQAAFAPEALPTWLPRLVLLVLGAAAAIARRRLAGARRGRARRVVVARVRAPLSSQPRSTTAGA
jgi:hypothetical protein